MPPLLMRHNKQAAPIVAKFAEKTCRSLRSAQWHRQRDTPAWKKFNGIGEESPPTQPPQPPQAQPQCAADAPPNTGTGMKGEIERIEAELIQLSRRLHEASKSKDLATELSLHRALDAKREGLRKLRLACPEIAREDGSVTPSSAVRAYVLRVVTHLGALPRRLKSVFPYELQPEAQKAFQAEIEAVMNEAARFDIES